ncbi:ATP-binding cassette domain-containing protein [Streptomyces sp. LN699]|uniref:ATP-binding cassette domain-containing protein n=1 Tax=Streptomyces sp. LN699 TaxID=3112981 RepID=UPI003720C11A
MENDAIHLRAVSRIHGSGDHTVTALDQVTLGFPRGSFTAVMGPSGSGKSTLLQCAAGLDRPTSGTVTIGDTELGGPAVLSVALRTRWITLVGSFLALSLGVGLIATMGLGLAATLDVPQRQPERFARAPVVVKGADTLRVTTPAGEHTAALAHPRGVDPALTRRLAALGPVAEDRSFPVRVRGRSRQPVGHPWAVAAFAAFAPHTLDAGRAPRSDSEVVTTGWAPPGERLTTDTGTLTVVGTVRQLSSGRTARRFSPGPWSTALLHPAGSPSGAPPGPTTWPSGPVCSSPSAGSSPPPGAPAASAPPEALREAAAETRTTTWGRGISGAALVLLSLATLLYGLLDDPSELLHRKPYLTRPMPLIVACALLFPLAVKPLIRLVGWLPARLPGAGGMLIRENAATGIRRTCAVAAPVLVTVALAGLVAGEALLVVLAGALVGGLVAALNLGGRVGRPPPPRRPGADRGPVGDARRHRRGLRGTRRGLRGGDRRGGPAARPGRVGRRPPARRMHARAAPAPRRATGGRPRRRSGWARHPAGRAARSRRPGDSRRAGPPPRRARRPSGRTGRGHATVRRTCRLQDCVIGPVGAGRDGPRRRSPGPVRRISR